MAAPDPNAAISSAENSPDLVNPAGVFPPFDAHNFVPQIVWLVIIFGALYWMMSRIALPRVGDILEARRTRIDGDLKDAALMQQQAAAASAAYDATLADAKARAQALAQQTHDALHAESETKRHGLEAELAAKLAAAEGQIADMKNRAMSNVEGIARDAAAAIIERLTGKAALPDALDAAVATAKTR